MERVNRGAALLDDVWGPEWRDEIECWRLDLGDESRCILAQLYGSYMGGLHALSEAMTKHDVSQYSCGFQAEDGEDYADLTATWLELLGGEFSAPWLVGGER